jgi:hypothetical protein
VLVLVMLQHTCVYMYAAGNIGYINWKTSFWCCVTNVSYFARTNDYKYSCVD